jgi:hypothetical protein
VGVSPVAPGRHDPRVADYSFLTIWLLAAERERVFEALWRSERWPEWWPGVVKATETEPGDANGIGRRGRYEWRSRIPYPVRFEVVSTRVEPPALLEGRASGDLEGVGRWRVLSDGDGISAALYEWNVRTTKPWMNLAGPVAAPVFRWNHDYLMRRGGEGLAELLGVPLLAAS